MIIQGRLGRDPEVKQTANGKTVVKFSVAEDQGWGEHKRTEWHNVTAWGKVGELIAKHFSKGKAIILDDFRIESREYEGKRYTDLVLNKVTFPVRDSQAAQQAAPASSGNDLGYGGGGFDDNDNIPF